MKLRIILIWLLPGIACSTSIDKVSTPRDSLIQPRIGKSVDTLYVDGAGAVFYSPDSIQIEKRKKSIGIENFMIGADDYIYYMNLSHAFLDSLKLAIDDAQNMKFVSFVNPDQTRYLIKLDTLPELWGVFLFDRNKKPKIADMTIIDQEYNSYYNN